MKSDTYSKNTIVGKWLKLSRKIFKLHTSLKNNSWFLFRTNIILIVMIVLFVVNKGEWRSVGRDKVMTFIFTYECLIIIYSTFACISPKQHWIKERISKNEWIGMAIAIFSTSLLSLFMLPANLPFPSTVIFLILSTNLLAAFYSVIFHNAAIGIYEMNVLKEKESITDYIFKYIAILFTSLNYYIQVALKGLPFILNKLFAIIFTIVLAMLLIVTGTVFTY